MDFKTKLDMATSIGWAQGLGRPYGSKRERQPVKKSPSMKAKSKRKSVKQARRKNRRR